MRQSSSCCTSSMTSVRSAGVTRRALLEELDRPHLKRLPTEPYGFAEWRLRRVGIDYHIEVDAHFYSVPHRFARREVEVRLTPQTVEIFLKGERIAVHRRGSGNHGHTTLAEHMPSSHRRYADWTFERIRRTAASIGPATTALLRSDPGAPAASGARLPRLSRHHPPCSAVRRCSPRSRSDPHRDRHPAYGSVRSILDHKLDQAPPRPHVTTSRCSPADTRGPRYYH